MKKATTTTAVEVKAPNFKKAVFKIEGIAPLVVHRFSEKLKEQMKQKMETGKAAQTGKDRSPKKVEDIFEEARYRSKEGWDGFKASAIRNSMIAACRLINYPMTLAKMSVVCIEDGWDRVEPQVPLVRIYGKAEMQQDWARTSTGEPYLCIRPAFYKWHANVQLRWDADQFTLEGITSLLTRAGLQVGICEGRLFSPKSAGMGWGLFEIVNDEKGESA